ncbi:MAG: sodium/calcium exchanger rane region [Betaproteobacteria bacterium]|nr:sodium/calcium exchanger rane region [Betaproteobacteria bacterium]
MRVPGKPNITMLNIVSPLAACALLAFAAAAGHGGGMSVVLAAALIASVLTAVHHAEVVAHRVGEPFGTLILAICVTVIEVALIVSMMLSGGTGKELIARDTLFAAIMIICNGVIGLSILAGGIRHGAPEFRVEGTNPALAVLAALSTLTLVLPNFTTSAAGPFYTDTQLKFAGLSSLILYGTFVFIQTMRHRDYFLPVGKPGTAEHAAPPTGARAFASGALLLVSLVAVIGLAKILSPDIERLLANAGAPQTTVGVAIALLVLLPEGFAAIRAALANRMQTSFNLALGSALASIGLTIPVVAMVSIGFGLPLTLGLGPVELVMLVLTLGVSILTLATGRLTVLQGVVHLVMFAAYIFLTLVP